MGGLRGRGSCPCLEEGDGHTCLGCLISFSRFEDDFWAG